MFIAKIRDWQKTAQILDQMAKVGEITPYQHFLFRKYALGHSIDEDLDPIDVTSASHAYSQNLVKLYKDPDLSKQFQYVFLNSGKPMRTRIFHRVHCKLFASDDPNYCICPMLDSMIPYSHRP